VLWTIFVLLLILWLLGTVSSTRSAGSSTSCWFSRWRACSFRWSKGVVRF